MSWHSTEKVKIPQMLWNREKRNCGTLEQLVLKIYGTNGPNGPPVEDAVKSKNEGNPKLSRSGFRFTVSPKTWIRVKDSLVFNQLLRRMAWNWIFQIHVLRRSCNRQQFKDQLLKRVRTLVPTKYLKCEAYSKTGDKHQRRDCTPDKRFSGICKAFTVKAYIK